MTFPYVKSQKCVATSKRTGQPCQSWAIRGTTVCRKHGGATPQVKRKAEARVALAEALARGDRRAPWDILFDALHAADTIMRDVRSKLSQDESVTTEEITRFVESFERAARLAKITLDAKAMEIITRVNRMTGEDIASVFNEAMAAAALPDEYNVRLRHALRDALVRRDTRDLGDRRAIEGAVVESNGSPTHNQL